MWNDRKEMKIRPLIKADLPTRVAWMNNPAVYRSMHFELPVLLDKTEEWFSKIINNDQRADFAFENEEGSLVAMGGITGIDRKIGKGEFYIFVNPSLQNAGYGRIASKLLCRHGFESLGLHKIYLYTNSDNIAARKVYERIGFQLEGTLRDEVVDCDRRADRLYYGLVADDFDDKSNADKLPVPAPMIFDEITVDDRRLMIVRDDLYPMQGGGNKARKALYYESQMINNGYDACVTTGGIQSNHNRAIAMMCARHGWKCHLVYHGSKERFMSEKGNALLVRKTGAEMSFTEANGIGPAMDSAMESLRERGFKPLYIHGGGHDLAGGMAFVEAVKELRHLCDSKGIRPRYIFHASGTGSTQAGIAVGLDLVGWSDVRLIGISVARQKERGTQVVEDFANMLASHYGVNKDYTGQINFITDYLCGGYENFTPQMSEYLDNVMANTGIMFDTTYSGKAFFGMMDYLSNHPEATDVLFWHTGGLMNLMS